jgi:hypothetical protein
MQIVLNKLSDLFNTGIVWFILIVALLVAWIMFFLRRERLFIGLIAAVTAIAWLYLLAGCIVCLFPSLSGLAPNRPADLIIGITLSLAVGAVFALAAYSAVRPSHAFAKGLLIASLMPACLFAYSAWELRDPSGARYFEILLRDDHGWDRLLEDITFIGLPFCWAVVSLATSLHRRSEI